ncbi:hypothetical protein [Mesorhizobium tamadayense]|uniref:hypothetical protein n=1 Tax=Mesorhizobium tamadayense TaxID=425306 RepID=UPI00142DEE28|nr:hypothetical protein [Mesorhizobium tamadayense]
MTERFESALRECEVRAVIFGMWRYLDCCVVACEVCFQEAAKLISTADIGARC